MKYTIFALAAVALTLVGCSSNTIGSVPSDDTVSTGFAGVSETLVAKDSPIIIKDRMFYEFWTAVYSSPDDYLGKTYTCSGMFDIAVIDGKTYYSVCHNDATGCCTAGVEVDWSDSFVSAYQDQCVTVTGTLEKYSDNGKEYLLLRLSSFELQQ